MSKILVLAFALFVSLCLMPGSRADCIDAMDVSIDAAKDSSLHVTEKIFANFSQPRHGIFRIMPVKYSRYGADYSIDFHLNSVVDDNKAKVDYQVNKQGNDVNIKIGSADKEITGRHIYVIDYTLRRALNFFNKRPEIYWNVTGDQWPYEIKEASLTLKLPQGVDSSDANYQAYLGPPGTTSGAAVTIKNLLREIYFKAQNIPAGSGMTVVVGLPQGAMVPPSLLSQIGWYLVDWYPAILLPLISFLALYATWRHLGVDEEPTGAIGVEWQPPKELTPAEMGVIVDEQADLNDIISIIFDLAARGYLKIHEIDKPGFWGSSKDYQLERLFVVAPGTNKKSYGDSNLKSFEREMLHSIFKSGNSAVWNDFVYLSTLRDDAAIDLSLIRKQLYDTMSERGWFTQNPETVRNTYRSIAGGLVVIPFFVCSVFPIAYAIPLILGLIFSGILFFFFANAMPARTLAGVQLRRQSLAFARFVDKAEKQRIKVLADKDPTIFGRLLPYALVLGAADRWANAFDGIAVTAPTWYVSSDPNYAFNPHTFVRDMGYGMNSMGSSVQIGHQSTSAGSGGSGFSGGSSGGGFGGGGGGSW